jgi:hypothetical protein
LQAGSGTFYETGYVSLNNEKIKYAIGLKFKRMRLANSANSNSWNTLYLGIQNVVSYSLLGRGSFDANIKLDLDLPA